MIPWQVPRTWTFGEMGNETKLNTIRDQLIHLKENQVASAGFFRGLRMRTHPDEDQRLSKVMLLGADQIVMDDGVAVADWPVLIADKTINGPGGLDAGSAQPSTWYEKWAIRKSSDGTRNLLLHRAKDYFLDESYDSDDSNTAIRNSTNTRAAAAQGFRVDTVGPVEFADVELNRIGIILAGNLWVELQSDSAGLPSGTVLAKSDVVAALEVGTANQWIRFLFRMPVSLVTGTQYHLVVTGDWAPNDTNTLNWRTDNSAPTYANGAMSVRNGAAWSVLPSSDASFRVYVTRNDTAVVMPAGYDQSCKIGYAYNNSAGNLEPQVTRDRATHALRENGTIIATATNFTNTPKILDCSAVIPPGLITLSSFGRITTPASFALGVGGVPDGWREYGGNIFGTRSGGRVVMDKGSGLNALLGVGVGVVNTECQAVYAVSAETVDILAVSGWEW